MKKVVKRLRIVVLLLSILMSPKLLLADDPDPFPPDVPDVPFDGGVSLLIAAGIGYGLKKVYDKKKEEKDGEVLEN